MEISGVDSPEQRMGYMICYLKEEEKLQKRRGRIQTWGATDCPNVIGSERLVSEQEDKMRQEEDHMRP